MPKNILEIEKKAKQWLKKVLSKQNIVFAKKDLPGGLLPYLEKESLFAELTRRYIFLKKADEISEESFKNNFWLIMFQFLNIAFKDGWYLTGSYSYSLALDDLSLRSKQISISTAIKSNRIIKLFDDIEILASYDPHFKEKPLVNKKLFNSKITLLKPEYLVINSTENEYRTYQSEIVSFLKDSNRDEKFIINYFKKNNAETLIARLIGALENLEDFSLRLELEDIRKFYGSNIKIKSPFSEITLINSVERPAYLTRFEISLNKAIKALQEIKKPARRSKGFSASDLDKVALEDSYHSLTIEGYNVTKALIEYLSDHNPSNDFSATLKDQLATKGFIYALNYIRRLLPSKFKVTEALAQKLFQELWKPSINAKILKSDFDIYRKHFVSIRGSQYVPPSHDKVPYLIDELFDYAREIEDGFELGIFLHYFYVTVHPHSDTNGRIARFLMNLAFVNDKYNWLTIRFEDRTNYFAALQESQMKDDIRYFAEYVINGT